MRRKHFIFAVAISLLLGSFVALVAVSQEKSRLQLYAEMDQAEKDLYNPDYGAYPIYKSAFDDLEGKIQSFILAHGELTGTKLSPKADWISALIDGIDKNLKAKRLSDSLKNQLTAIETQGNEVEFLWLDVAAAWHTYYNAVGAYNYHLTQSGSPSEELIGITEPTKETPTSLYFCNGSCDELFETASSAQVSHQVYCPEKHGTSGTTGVTFYLCSGSCDRSSEHWRVCGGTCGNKYAPKRINRGHGNYSYVANSPHYVKCAESVYSFLNPNAKCGEEYYTCEDSTCPDSSRHWSGSTPPSMHPCNVHETSVSGDHSLQSSCTSSNANGTCTVTSFYACDNHTHSYPSPPPPPPPTTLCPANGWTNCGSTKSHAKECGGGDTYYTCNPSALAYHGDKSCRRAGCSNTWSNCQSAPWCDAWQGNKCWAE